MRRLAWFSGGFGALCLLCCLVEHPLLWGAAAAVLFAVSLTITLICRPRREENPDLSLLSRKRRGGFQLCRRCAAFLLGGALAAGWFAGYSALFRAPAQQLAGATRSITGTVTTWPEATSIGGWSMVLEPEGGITAPDILLYGDETWGTLRPGDRVTCTARLKASDRLYGEETTYYTAKGVFLLGYCDETPAVERPSSVPFRFWPKFCARALLTGIHAAFDEGAAPLTAAVTLGDKEGLDTQLHSALTRSGMMHAAVVSGMHISFLVGVLLFLCRNDRRVALVLLPLLIFYAYMVGGTPSAFRAVIMQTALLAGPVLNRDHDGPTALGLALLVLLAQNPYAAASISLQLSFASVAGIQLTAEPIARFLQAPLRPLRNGGSRIRRLVWAAARAVAANLTVTLGAMLFTAPLIALYFQQISLAGVISNLLALWAATVLTVCGLLVGTLAVFLPGAAGVLGAAAGLLARYMEAVVRFFGRLPLSSLDISTPYFRIWLVALYLMIPLVALSHRKWRQILISLLSLALLLGGAVGLNRRQTSRDELVITALNVEQGASTLFLSGDAAVLVDCGGSVEGDAGDLAADRLSALGRSRLDALVLTHLDDDHFNGVAQLFWRTEIAAVYLPLSGAQPEALTRLMELAEQEGAALCFVTDTVTLAMGDARFTLYPPLGGGASNEEGLFVLCSCGEFDALITGDADSFVENMLLKYYPIPDLELLLVGHHGSRRSTSEALLAATRPELAVISVGYNSYGHPADEVLARLDAWQVRTYRTDLHGPVTLSLRDGQISIH